MAETEEANAYADIEIAKVFLLSLSLNTRNHQDHRAGVLGLMGELEHLRDFAEEAIRKADEQRGVIDGLTAALLEMAKPQEEMPSSAQVLEVGGSQDIPDEHHGTWFDKYAQRYGSVELVMCEIRKISLSGKAVLLYVPGLLLAGNAKDEAWVPRSRVKWTKDDRGTYTVTLDQELAKDKFGQGK